MNLQAFSWRLTHLVIELIQDAPLNKKLLYIYFNELVELDETLLPAEQAKDLKNIKLMFSHPNAVTFDKLTHADLMGLAARIVLLMAEVSFQAGCQSGREALL